MGMTTPQAVLDVARAELEVEGDANNDTKYSEWYGLPNEAWCFMFVSWCFATAGDTEIHMAYTPTGVNYFRAQGRFDNTPRVGDCIFYDWGADGMATHVGLVEVVNPDGTLVTIEGNRGGYGEPDNNPEVSRHSVPGEADWSVVLGFGHPLYDSPPPSPEADMPLSADDLNKITTIVSEQATHALGAKLQEIESGVIQGVRTILIDLFNHQYWPIFATELNKLGIAQADIDNIAAKVGASTVPGS